MGWRRSSPAWVARTHEVKVASDRKRASGPIDPSLALRPEGLETPGRTSCGSGVRAVGRMRTPGGSRASKRRNAVGQTELPHCASTLCGTTLELLRGPGGDTPPIHYLLESSGRFDWDWSTIMELLRRRRRRKSCHSQNHKGSSANTFRLAPDPSSRLVPGFWDRIRVDRHTRRGSTRGMCLPSLRES